MDFNKFKEWFEAKFSPTTQTKIKKYGIVIFVLLIITAYYYGSGKDKERKEELASKEPKEVVVQLDESLMEDDVRESIKKDVQESVKNTEESQKRLDALEKQNDDLEKLIQQLTNPDNQTQVQAQNGAIDPIDDVRGNSTPYGGAVEYPPSNSYFAYDGAPQQSQALPEAAPELVGGIGYSAGVSKLVEDTPPEKKRLIRLPPSFMKASLLVGIDAMTSQMGEGNPEPIVLRVQAPAILPNQVKQNLRGCFIVADAYGNLAKERVQVRLQSLHCNSTDGKAVIDQKIEGFVADTDGKRDAAGIVQSKAGAAMARAALAAAIGGVGQGLSGVGQTTITTATTASTEVEEDKLLLGAAASGVGAGASEIAGIYTDLVKQTTPTIEIGAAKKLVVFIQKEVMLEIKEYN